MKTTFCCSFKSASQSEQKANPVVLVRKLFLIGLTVKSKCIVMLMTTP